VIDCSVSEHTENKGLDKTKWSDVYPQFGGNFDLYRASYSRNEKEELERKLAINREL
jgi:hypothetical protein